RRCISNSPSRQPSHHPRAKRPRREQPRPDGRSKRHSSFTVGRYGIKSIGSLGMLIGTFYVACIFFVIVVRGTLAWMHKFKLWQLLRYIREDLLVVLGTSSSEPVLPRLLMKLERLGRKKGVVGLVLPTGYSFDLDGTAIYLTLASMFIAQACDITLSWTQIGAMLGLMLLTSKGAAGVTGSGFVALVATLAVMPDLLEQDAVLPKAPPARALHTVPLH